MGKSCRQAQPCQTVTAWQIAIDGERLDVSGCMTSAQTKALTQRLTRKGFTLMKRYLRSPCLCHKMVALTFSREVK